MGHVTRSTMINLHTIFEVSSSSRSRYFSGETII